MAPHLTSEAAARSIATVERQREKIWRSQASQWWVQWALLPLTVGFFYLQDVGGSTANIAVLAVAVGFPLILVLGRRVPALGAMFGQRYQADARAVPARTRLLFTALLMGGFIGCWAMAQLALQALGTSGASAWFAQHPWTTQGTIASVLFLLVWFGLRRAFREIFVRVPR